MPRQLPPLPLQRMGFMDLDSQFLLILNQGGQALAIQVHKSHPLQRQWRELARHFQIVYWPLADLQRQNGENWRFAASEKGREAFFSGILAGHVVDSDDTPWQGAARYTDNKSDLRMG